MWWRNNESFYCIKCFKEALPFGFANDNNFHQAVTLGLNSENFDDLNFTISKTEKKIMKFLKKTISENSDPNIKNSLCKYYSIDDFCTKNYKGNQYFSIFHLNIHSLQFHKHDLEILLNALKLKFDIIAISETKLRKGNSPRPWYKLTTLSYSREHS